MHKGQTATKTDKHNATERKRQLCTTFDYTPLQLLHTNTAHHSPLSLSTSYLSSTPFHAVLSLYIASHRRRLLIVWLVLARTCE